MTPTQFVDLMKSVDTIVVNGGHQIKSWVVMPIKGKPDNVVFGVIVMGYDAPHNVLRLTESDIEGITVRHNKLKVRRGLEIEVYFTEVITLLRPYMIEERVAE